ncbi:MAG: hypothetical protein J4215_01090 [Candidatus Diapherotrites archaeon]|uniref:Response regulator n=1 Tax=Candidatus Iainarchaeum sp. TaxID=3101447 RepID=A0A8T4L6I4_9ARCH|nr:hypothetical protein [Candidatus Diapherotrites archaeon]
MPKEPKPRILMIEDAEGQRNACSSLLKMWGFDVVAVGSVSKALKAIEGKPFNAIITDVSVENEKGRGVPTPIEFLKLCEARFPRTHLAVHTGIDKPDKPFSGIDFISKGYFEEFTAYVDKLKKNPWKKPIREKINLEQYLWVVMHTTASGRKELVQLIHANPEDIFLLDRIRRGWRPRTFQQDLAALRREIETAPTQAEADRLWRNLQAMRKKAGIQGSVPIPQRKWVAKKTRRRIR